MFGDLMDLFTPSDWDVTGGANWQTDVNAARAELARQLEQFGRGRGLASADTARLVGWAESSGPTATSATEYWTLVGYQLPALPAELGIPMDAGQLAGWQKLLDAYGINGAARAAAVSAQTVEQGVTARDVAEVLDETANEALNPLESWVPWAVGAAVLGGLYLYLQVMTASARRF